MVNEKSSFGLGKEREDPYKTFYGTEVHLRAGGNATNGVLIAHDRETRTLILKPSISFDYQDVPYIETERPTLFGYSPGGELLVRPIQKGTIEKMVTEAHENLNKQKNATK